MYSRLDWKGRKDLRRLSYYKWEYGWILVDCVACSGSGIYDHNGSPPCGACDGTGKVKKRGPKAIRIDLQ